MEKLAVRRSPLGWVVFGAGTEGITIRNKHVLHVRLTSLIDLTDFWETESMGVASSSCKCPQVKMSVGEQRELKLIEESCKLINKQWMVSYPWKRDPAQLPDNQVQVQRKLEITEAQLIKQPEIGKAYDDQMKDMEDRGFLRKLSDKEVAEWKGPVHYVSHHAVVRPEKKKSTPVPIVFNSSATFKGHCLSDF